MRHHHIASPVTQADLDELFDAFRDVPEQPRPT